MGGGGIPAISLVSINYLIAEGAEISNALIFLEFGRPGWQKKLPQKD